MTQKIKNYFNFIGESILLTIEKKEPILEDLEGNLYILKISVVVLCPER